MSDAFTPTPQAHAPVPEAVTPVAPSAPAARPPLPWEKPASQPEAAHPPVQQAAPESEPEATPSQPSAPSGPSPDELERLRAQAAQFEELQRRVQQEQERLAREAETTRRNEEFNRKAQEIWDLSQRFDTEDERRDYYQRQMGALRSETEQFYRAQVEAERAQIEQERMAQLVAGYPDFLAKEFSLDPEDVEELRQLTDPNQMTATARAMKRYKERFGELRSIAEQARADATAATLRSTVTTGNVSGASGAREMPTQVRAGSPESRELLAAVFGMRK